MKSFAATLAIGATLALASSGTTAFQGQASARYAQSTTPGSSEPTQPHFSGPGGAVNDQANQRKSEPGVTKELAPDAKETATGGPVGGSPSRSTGR